MGDQKFLDILDELRALHLKKSADYGGENDPLQNIRAASKAGVEPWRAAWVRALDKVHRINAFCQKGQLVNEGVQDSLMDLAAYAIIVLRLMREHERLVGKMGDLH